MLTAVKIITLFGCVANNETGLSPYSCDDYLHDCVYFTVERREIIELFKKKINIENCISGKAMDKQTKKIFAYLCFFTGYEQTEIDDDVYYGGDTHNGHPFMRHVSRHNTHLFFHFRNNYRNYFEIPYGREVAGGYGYW